MNRVHLGALGDPNCDVGMPYDVFGNACDDEGPGFVDTADTNVPVYGPPAPTAGDIAYDKGYMTAKPTPNPAYNFQPVDVSGNPIATQPAQPAVSQFPSGIVLAPGPANRIQIGFGTPGAFGLWFSGSTLIPGLPNWGVVVGGVVLLSVFGGVFAAKRRR